MKKTAELKTSTNMNSPTFKSATFSPKLKRPDIELGRLDQLSANAITHEKQISVSTVEQPEVKNQIDQLRMDLDKCYNLLDIYVYCSKRTLAVLMAIAFILSAITTYIIDSCVIFTFITIIIVAVVAALLTLKTNTYILKQALQSFVVWYKCINAGIAVTCRNIYYNFWIGFYTKHSINKGIGIPMYYIVAVAVIIASILAVVCVSVSDGIPHTKLGGRIKRFGMFLVIVYFSSRYVNLFWDLSIEYVNNPSIKLKLIIFGQGHSIYLRTIALSCYLRVVIFSFTQLIRCIKHPNKVNIIPLPVKINYVKMQIHMQQEHIDDHNQEYDQHGQQKQKQKQKQKNNNNTGKYNSKRKIQIGKRREAVNRLQIELSDLKIDNFNERNFSHDEASYKYDTRSDGENFNFSINLEIERTLCYIILRNVFKLDLVQSLDYSSRLLNWKYVLFFCSSIIICSVLKYFLYYVVFNTGGWVLVIIDTWLLLACALFFLNINYKLLYFKKNTYLLYWKLLNMISLSLAINTLNAKYDLNQFSLNKNFNVAQTHLLTIIPLIYILIVTCIISLHQGYNVSKKYKLVAIGAFIVFFVRFLLWHFFHDEIDHQASLFFNHKVSLRGIVMTNSFDLIIWFGYQFVQVYKQPHVIKLTSKIEIHWIS